MEGSMSTKRRVGEKLLMPLVAAGTSAAASYLVKKGPAFVEDTLWPRLRDAAQGAAQGAGGVAEKLPDKVTDTARSAVSGGGDLAGQLTERARDLTGLESGGGDGAGRRLSPNDLAQRSDERARHRAQRRRKTRR
jgi:hypothetical protein